MKKIILSGLICSTLLIANQVNIIPISGNNLSLENGGSLSAIDAYSDGIGVVVDSKIKIDNSALNDLVFKYGEKAKLNNTSLKSFVLDSSNNDIDLLNANKLGLLSNNSPVVPPLNGTSCNDGNSNTINDIYINGACIGEVLEGQSCNDNNLQTINDKYVNGVCLGTNAEGQSCDDNNLQTINDKYVNGVCLGTIPLTCQELKTNNPTATTGTYTLNGISMNCDMTTAGGGWRILTASEIINGNMNINEINGYEIEKVNRLVDYRGKTSGYKKVLSVGSNLMQYDYCQNANDNCSTIYRKVTADLPFTVGNISHQIYVSIPLLSSSGDADSSKAVVSSVSSTGVITKKIDTGYGNWSSTGITNYYTSNISSGDTTISFEGYCSRSGGVNCDGTVGNVSVSLDTDLPDLTTSLLTK